MWSACVPEPERGPSSTTSASLDAATSTIVVDVVDGDTLDVAIPGGGEERVRILGINAPEQGECLTGDATEALSRLVAGAEVDLVVDRSDRDRYGRLLRYVEVDGDDVGVALVREGLAVVRVSEPDTARVAALRAAEAEARDRRSGLWDSSACGPSTAGAEGMRVVALRLDAEGDDSQNLNDEWVELRNEGSAAVDLTGWRVRDESASNRFDFPDGFTLAPGSEVRIRSGCGAPTATELFWCTSGAAIWNNDGDTAFLLDPAGNVVHSLAG
jgi:micrococcal nuclease